MLTLMGSIGALFYILSLLCLVGVFINIACGSRRDWHEAGFVATPVYGFGICCIIFWLLGWLVRTAVFV